MQSNPQKTDKINKETKFNKFQITELKILYKTNIFLLLMTTVKIFVLFLLLGILTIWPTVANYCVVIFIQLWGRIEVCTGCWRGSLRQGGHWGGQEVDGRIILRWIFRKLEVVVGTGWS
jgi:hypothetical protein